MSYSFPSQLYVITIVCYLYDFIALSLFVFLLMPYCHTYTISRHYLMIRILLCYANLTQYCHDISLALRLTVDQETLQDPV